MTGRIASIDVPIGLNLVARVTVDVCEGEIPAHEVNWDDTVDLVWGTLTVYLPSDPGSTNSPHHDIPLYVDCMGELIGTTWGKDLQNGFLARSTQFHGPTERLVVEEALQYGMKELDGLRKAIARRAERYALRQERIATRPKDKFDLNAWLVKQRLIADKKD